MSLTTRFCGCWVSMVKKPVVCKNLVNEANEEVQPVNEETAAIEIKTEVLRSDTRA